MPLASTSVISDQPRTSTSPPILGPAVVVLIHGIRTRALWMGPLRRRLMKVLPAASDVEPAGYGYFDLFCFVLPGLFRWLAVRKVEKKLNAVLAGRGDRRLVIIAHSFGTYIITRILARRIDIRVDTLVLCGSVVSPNYDWGPLLGHVTTVVNECGGKDVWPVLAKDVTWGYGATGVFGFQYPRVRDRMHFVAHSDYFSPKFFRANWLPLVQRGLVTPDSWDPTKQQPSILVRVLDKTPLKWLALAAIVLTVTSSIGVPEPLRPWVCGPENTVTFKGQISDETRKPLNGATVGLNDFTEYAPSDPSNGSDGSYKLNVDNVPRGEATLHVLLPANRSADGRPYVGERVVKVRWCTVHADVTLHPGK